MRVEKLGVPTIRVWNIVKPLGLCEPSEVHYLTTMNMRGQSTHLTLLGLQLLCKVDRIKSVRQALSTGILVVKGLLMFSGIKILGDNGPWSSSGA